MNGGSDDVDGGEERRGRPAESARILMSQEGTARIDSFGRVAPGNMSFLPFMMPRIPQKSMSSFNSVTKSTPPYSLLNGKVFPEFRLSEFLRFFVLIVIRSLEACRPLETVGDILTAYLNSIAHPKTPAKSALRAAVRSFATWHDACGAHLIDSQHRDDAARNLAILWAVEDDLVAIGAAPADSHDALASGPLYSCLGHEGPFIKHIRIRCLPAYREIVLRRWYELRFSLTIASIYADVFPVRGSSAVKGAYDVRIHHDAITQDTILTRMETAFVYSVFVWHNTFLSACVLRVGTDRPEASIFMAVPTAGEEDDEG